jgi:Lon protease-like protein
LPTFAERYRGPADLPRQIPVFPLRGAILLPRAALRLNVFEARYLALVDDALQTSRILVIVQPAGPGEDESPPGKSEPLKRVGCVGRLSAFQELEDGRLLITLTGIARCRLTDEIDSRKPYRLYSVSCEPFTGDFAAGAGEGEVDRERLLTTLKRYLQARQLKADWPAILKSPSEALVNALCIMCPYGPEEKQALLEAPDLKTRAEALVALAEMELASGSDGSGTTLQ